MIKKDTHVGSGIGGDIGSAISGGIGGGTDNAIPSKPDGEQHNEPELEAQNQQQVLLRGIAHDVNNNLMAIMAACDQIERKIPAESVEANRLLTTVRTHIQSTAMLMRDLVNNRNMEKPVVMTETALYDFLSGLLSSLTLVTDSKVTVELGMIKTAPVLVQPLFLHRVLMQLIRNVAELDVDHPLAFIAARQVKGWCEISISDNGPGLGAITADEVFKPGTTTKGEARTRGYGLSAVAWAVEKWGGTYGVEAIKNDSGCRFWVRMPLDKTGDRH